MATRGDDGGAKSRPSGTFTNMMGMLPFKRGVALSSDPSTSVLDRLMSIICREAAIQFIDGCKFVCIQDIPLEHTPGNISEREFRECADAIVAHPFFEGVTVSYQIKDINTHPGSPRNLWADFEIRWE